MVHNTRHETWVHDEVCAKYVKCDSKRFFVRKTTWIRATAGYPVLNLGSLTSKQIPRGLVGLDQNFLTRIDRAPDFGNKSLVFCEELFQQNLGIITMTRQPL